MPKCPECNTPNAYVGFFVVECRNPQCRHYVCAHGASGEAGQAYVSSGDLPPEIQAAVDEFVKADFPRELRSIQEAVGNAIPVTMDFRNVGSNLKALRLLIRVLSRVRSTLCLRSSQHQEALRAGILRVAIRHCAPGERRCCTLAYGVLDMRVSVEEQAAPTQTSAGTLEYNENDADQMVADALDLELGPAIRKLQEWLLDALAELNESVRLHLIVDVDWRSFASNPDNRVNLQVIDRLSTELHQHILYWLRSHAANDKQFRKQLKHTLHSVRLEHVASAAQRELLVDDAAIVYRFCLTEDNGAWGYELGDALHAAVMSVQPPPAPEAVAAWLAQHGHAALQRIARLPDGMARTAFDAYLKRDLPPAALRIEQAAGAPVALEIDWENLCRSAELVSRLNSRVLNRICGALTLASKDASHAALLKEGALERIAVSFTDDPAAKSCSFGDKTLRLTVCPSQPGAGCFDEPAMASALSCSLAVDARLSELKAKVAEEERRLCAKLGSWIAFSVDYAGFTSHPESGKNQLALMQLGEAGIDWVFYALTGQCEEEPDFRPKLLDRVRAIRFVHTPNPKDKSVSAEGATLVYRLSLHEGYNGRFIIDHLKEIFDEVVATMAPGAPVSPELAAEFERLERELLPAINARIVAASGVKAPVQIDCASFGNNLLAVRAIGESALEPLAKAFEDLARDKETKKKLGSFITEIVLRHVADRDASVCVLEDDGELGIETCLSSPDGDNPVSSSEIYNAIREGLPESEEEPADDRDASDDEEDEDDANERDSSNTLTESPAARMQRLCAQLGQIVGVLNQMSGASMVLEGDWGKFAEVMSEPGSADNASLCVENFPQVLLAMLLQIQMINPAFNQRLKAAVKIVRFTCAGAGEPRAILLENGVLICRLQPVDGMAGGFEMSELYTKLPQALGV